MNNLNRLVETCKSYSSNIHPDEEQLELNKYLVQVLCLIWKTLQGFL